MQARALAVLMLLAPALLAGCVAVTDQLQPSGAPAGPVDDVLRELGVVQGLRVVSFDGTPLTGTLYLPDMADAGCPEAVMRGHDVPEACRVPVILELSPYFGNLDTRTNHEGRTTGEFAPGIIYRHFLERGYAVALVNVRGTGESGGCFNLGGVVEQRDAYEVVERLGAAPWSNGNVAMMGVSYPGTTPWEAAVTAPPSLKAIVPISGISDMYEYMFANGVAYGHGPLFNTYYTALVDWAFTPWDPMAAAEQAHRTPESVCDDVLANIPKGYQTWADGNHDAFWDERDYAARAGDVETAVFLVHGLQDWNVDPDATSHVFNDLEGPKRALLGQWAHNIPWRNTHNPDWDYKAFNATILQWLDHHLKGVENGATNETPVLVQDSSGRWHGEQDWPPTRAQAVALHLTADGLRPAPPGADAAPRSFQSTPQSEPGPDALPGAQVAFESPAMAEDLLIMGVPEVELFVEVDRAGGHVASVLFEVTAEGDWERVNMAYQSLAHRNGRDQGEPVPTDEVLRTRTEMYPAATLVEAGHKLVLVVAGEDPDRILEDWTQPRVTLHHDAERPSRLVLPVMPEEDGGLLDGEDPRLTEAIELHG